MYATQTRPAVSAAFRAELGGEVIGPRDAGYDAARAVVFAKDRRPAAVVRPRDADEVAAAVALARELELELAVRSGGHSPAAHGSSDGGVVLDLSAMKRVAIDPVTRVARAETGLTAGELTAAVGEHGLAVGFGDAGTVGIGGITLGGGVGFLSRKHGLTIDNLLGVDVVTADGDVLRVNEERHPDLFWALRGGGGNFGVATRFRYRLQPVDLVTGGMLVLPATPETVAGFVAAAEAAPDEVTTIAMVMPGAALPFLPGEHQGGIVLAAIVVHCGPAELAAEALAPFRAVARPLADLIRLQRYPELYEGEPHPDLPISVATFFRDTVDVDDAAEMIDALGTSTALGSFLQIRVLGGAIARVAPEATAFAHRRRRVLGMAAAMYPHPGERPVHERWTRSVAAALRQGPAGAYVNFLGDEGEARVRAAYPGGTWERLAEVKRRYDPDNVFRLNQNVPPEPEAG